MAQKETHQPYGSLKERYKVLLNRVPGDEEPAKWRETIADLKKYSRTYEGKNKILAAQSLLQAATLELQLSRTNLPGAEAELAHAKETLQDLIARFQDTAVADDALLKKV